MTYFKQNPQNPQNPTLGESFPDELKPKKKYRTLKEREYILEQARNLRAQGYELKTIGQTLGVHPTSICKMLRGRIQRKQNTHGEVRKPITEQEKQTAQNLYNQGIHINEIAKKLNRHPRSLYKFIDLNPTKQPTKLSFWSKLKNLFTGN